MTDLELIEELSLACGVSGFEDEILEIAKTYCADFATVERDSMNNLFIRPNYNKGREYVILDAHSDEVGFMVQAIKPDGTLKFVPIGGWSENSLPSSSVQVATKSGYIRGVIVAQSPHLMSADQKNAAVKIENLSIDIGATSIDEVLTFGVKVGSPVVPLSPFDYDEKKGVMLGKAFDDRLGVAALLTSLRRLQSKDLDIDVIGVISSQEEVGERGITAAMCSLDPLAAICLEACPADDTAMPEYMVQARLHGGVMLRHMDRTVICTPKFTEFADRLASENEIKHQMAVRSGGGNNGAYIISSKGGVPTVVASVPVRYIHTFTSIAAMDDFNSTVELCVELMKNLTPDICRNF